MRTDKYIYILLKFYLFVRMMFIIKKIFHSNSISDLFDFILIWS